MIYFIFIFKFRQNKNVILSLSLSLSLFLSRHYSRTSVFVTCAKDSMSLQADSEDADQTGRMLRLIWVFAGRTVHFVGFVMLWLICKLKFVQRVRYKAKLMRSLVKAHYFRPPTCICFKSTYTFKLSLKKRKKKKKKTYTYYIYVSPRKVRRHIVFALVVCPSVCPSVCHKIMSAL